MRQRTQTVWPLTVVVSGRIAAGRRWLAAIEACMEFTGVHSDDFENTGSAELAVTRGEILDCRSRPRGGQHIFLHSWWYRQDLDFTRCTAFLSGPRKRVYPSVAPHNTRSRWVH